MKKRIIKIVVGRSMLPFIRDSDFAVLIQAERYYLFEIVGYWNRKSKKLVLHRIVRFRKDGRVTLHGDNSVSFFKAGAGFEVIGRKDIKGRLDAIIRDGSIIRGFKLKTLSAISFLLALVKLLPFLVKKYMFRIKK